MKNWRCRKMINMDEDLYAKINNLIIPGLQSKILGLIIEDYLDNLPKDAEAANLQIAELIVRCCAEKAREDGHSL